MLARSFLVPADLCDLHGVRRELVVLTLGGDDAGAAGRQSSLYIRALHDQAETLLQTYEFPEPVSVLVVSEEALDLDLVQGHRNHSCPEPGAALQPDAVLHGAVVGEVLVQLKDPVEGEAVHRRSAVKRDGSGEDLRVDLVSAEPVCAFRRQLGEDVCRYSSFCRQLAQGSQDDSGFGVNISTYERVKSGANRWVLRAPGSEPVDDRRVFFHLELGRIVDGSEELFLGLRAQGPRLLLSLQRK